MRAETHHLKVQEHLTGHRDEIDEVDGKESMLVIFKVSFTRDYGLHEPYTRPVRTVL
jgi:hypothetical protein